MLSVASRSRRFSLTTTAVCAMAWPACVVAQTQGAAVPTERYLKDLGEAQDRWSAGHPANYSYTIDVGAGPFGYHTVRLEVIGSACSATIRHSLWRKRRQWDEIPCEGYRMDDLFAALRKTLAGSPDSYSATFDSVLCYVQDVRVDPSANAEDEDWGYHMQEFSIAR